MSVIVVCMGQCGNQLAVDFFGRIARQCADERGSTPAGLAGLRRFFRTQVPGGIVAGVARRPARPPVPVSPHDGISPVVTEAQSDKLDAALGLAKRVRSRSAGATHRPSPYAASAPSVGKAGKPPSRALSGIASKSRAEDAAKKSRSASKGPVSRSRRPPSGLREEPTPAVAKRAVLEPTSTTCDITGEPPEPSSRLIARAVLLDMEPKVIQASLDVAKRSKLWCFDEKQVFHQQSGSGNNWAHGYKYHGPRCAPDITKLIAREVALAPDLEGFIILQSVAGGTGSGLGAFVTEMLRDLYPDLLLINVVVWPFSAGEVCVQHYNSVLTLSTLSKLSDGIVLLENDVASSVCRKLLNITSPRFPDLNNVLAKLLCSLLLPVWEPGSPEPVSLTSLVSHLCSHPTYRIVTLRMLPMMPAASVSFSVHTWSGILKHLKQMVITGSSLDEGMSWRTTEKSPSCNKSVSLVVMLHGNDVAGAVDEARTHFSSADLYPSWATSRVMCLTSSQTVDGYEKMAACASVSKHTATLLDATLARASEMFAAAAFLHQYEMFGLTREDFVAAFATLEQITKCLQSL